MGILDVRDVTLTLGGKKVIDHLSIDFWEGHIHALVGPNGAGKSSLAYTLMGLPGYRNYEGDILMDGMSIRDLDVATRARKGLTLAWQEPARYEGLTVHAFITAAIPKDVPSAEKTKLAREALHRVGLDPFHYLFRKVDKTLSGGERKRIELASILTMKPRIVLMDEPDSGIDVEALEKIFDALHLLKLQGSTIIMITHSLSVLKQAEHAFLLCNGRLLDKGSIEKVQKYFEGKCLSCSHPNEPVKEEQAV
jgi:Fe-S cluster assembly ATP-binding protein